MKSPALHFLPFAAAVALTPFLATAAVFTNSTDSAGATNAASAAEAVVDAPEYVPPAGTYDSEREVWNRGYDFWKAGDATNALATLKPLMLSREYGARAAEVVGALEHANAKSARAEDPEKAAAAAEEAAAAMQIALRAAPDDARANRNFTRALDPLGELREIAHVAKAMKEAHGKQPDGMLADAVREARSLMEAQKGVLTNSAAAAVAGSERLARRAEKLADVWIPLKQGVMQSVTNEQQAAMIVGDIESARDATRRSADLLDDMSPEAGADLAKAENALNRFWKLSIMPPAAVGQSIVCQSNAFLAVGEFNGRPWQNESLDFTRAFRARFPQWAQQYEQQAQADTNKPPFTKERQAEIAALAEQVEKMQASCVEKEDPPTQEAAINGLLRIRELLPKDGGGNGSGQPPPPQDGKKDRQDQDRQDQPPQPQENEQDRQDDDRSDDGKQQKDDQSDAGGQDDPKDDREVEDLLRKAQERSDEHEADKKARARKIPLPPNERDW